MWRQEFRVGLERVSPPILPFLISWDGHNLRIRVREVWDKIEGKCQKDKSDFIPFLVLTYSSPCFST